jgi:hypothetical protein
VPVEFLTEDQAAAYGRFGGEPSRAELERFFFLDDSDRGRVEKRRGEHNQLGYAVQLGTVRFLGTFLTDPLDVPWSVVDYVAVQLDVADSSVIKRYTEREKTAYEHGRSVVARLLTSYPRDHKLEHCGGDERLLVAALSAYDIAAELLKRPRPRVCRAPTGRRAVP